MEEEEDYYERKRNRVGGMLVVVVQEIWVHGMGVSEHNFYLFVFGCLLTTCILCFKNFIKKQKFLKFVQLFTH
jgi:hypothetical protein